jgi:hypothetical protein
LSTVPALAPFVDIALALVGVWVVMSAVALDTAAAGTVGSGGYCPPCHPTHYETLFQRRKFRLKANDESSSRHSLKRWT